MGYLGLGCYVLVNVFYNFYSFYKSPLIPLQTNKVESFTILKTACYKCLIQLHIYCDIISDCCWKNISCSWWRFVFGLWWQVSLCLHKAPRTKWPGISKGRWSSTAHQKTRVIAKISRIWKRNVTIRGRVYTARLTQMKIHAYLVIWYLCTSKL